MIEFGRIVNLLEEINNKLDDYENQENRNMKMMSVKETARFLGWSRDKVRKEIRCNNIPAIKYGRRYAVPKWRLLEKINEEIDEFER